MAAKGALKTGRRFARLGATLLGLSLLGACASYAGSQSAAPALAAERAAAIGSATVAAQQATPRPAALTAPPPRTPGQQAKARQEAMQKAAAARSPRVREALARYLMDEAAAERARAAAPIQAETIAAADRLRDAVVEQVPFRVSLWTRRASDRQFMVRRSDRQPMFHLDWSRERAELAVAQAYGGDCGGAGHLALVRSNWDPVGVWVIDAVCR